MNPTYYTVTRFLWSVALKCDVWFRLTYERTYLPERGLYRDKLSTQKLRVKNPRPLEVWPGHTSPCGSITVLYPGGGIRVTGPFRSRVDR